MKIFSFRRNVRTDLVDFNLKVGMDETSAYNAIFNESWRPEMKPGMVGAVVILTSRYMSLLKAVFDNPTIYFHVLELPYAYMSIPEVKELLLKNRNRIGHVFDNDPRSYEAFFQVNQSDYDLKFAQIREYSTPHQKAQRMLMRHVFDMNEVDHRFIHSLRFWLGVFERNDIQVVFSDRAEHGDGGDSLVYEVANRHKVPIYLMAVETASFESLGLSLKRWNASHYEAVSMKDILGGETGIDVRQYIHNKGSANVAAFSNHAYNEKPILETGRRLKRQAMRAAAMRRRCTDRKLFETDTVCFSSWGARNPIQVYREWRHVLDLLHAYNAVAVDPNPGDRYVFYALHMEPEASINNRGLISSQLFAIKTLAQSLPKGWKLYVKEHPQQFSVCNDAAPGFFHMSNNIGYFRTKQFYAEILRNSNTFLMPLGVPSETLIGNAVAVATICGTVAMEAIAARKPLIVFSDETCIASKVRDVCRVHSMGECAAALAKIDEGFEPAYDDLNEIANSYLMEIRDYKSLQSNCKDCDKLGGIVDWVFSQTKDR